MSLPTGQVVFIERDVTTHSVLWVLRFPVEELRYAGVFEDKDKKHYTVLKLAGETNYRRIECPSADQAGMMVTYAAGGGERIYCRTGVKGAWAPVVTPRSAT